MPMNYNLQESISEECFNDIMSLVQEYIENVSEEQHAFATYLDSLGHKYISGLLKALGGDTAKVNTQLRANTNRAQQNRADKTSALRTKHKNV